MSEPKQEEIQKGDWYDLIRSIRGGQCILVIGPEIRGNDGWSLPEELAAKLYEESAYMREISHLGATHLPHVAEFYKRINRRRGLEKAAVDFYHARRGALGEFYAELASLPFSIILSLCYDDGLVEALEARGKAPKREIYHFLGEKKSLIGRPGEPLGSVQAPLVYHLFGHVAERESLVLTDSESVDFLTGIMSERPLPFDLQNELKDSHFLLIGFGLTRWYLRLLLRILEITEKTRATALERLPEQDAQPLLEHRADARPDLEKAIFFLKKSLGVNVDYRMEPLVFVRHLKSLLADEPPTEAPAAGPKVFISYASEDRAWAEKIYLALSRERFEVWIDKEKLLGGDAWDRILEQKIQREADYVVVVQSAALTAKRGRASYVNNEINLARDRQRYFAEGVRFIIPVTIDDSPLRDELSHLQAVALDSEEGLSKLVEAIRDDLRRRR